MSVVYAETLIVFTIYITLTKKEKTFSIGNKDRRISDSILEIDKCQLLCKNCHKKTHALESGIVNFEIKLKMLNYVGVYCCSKCKYSECISALEFHHVDKSTKLFNLSDATISLKGMIANGEIADIVKTELDKCIVLCSQCHAEEHYDFDFDAKYADEIEYHSRNIKEIQPKLDRELVKFKFESGMRVIDISRELKASKGTVSDILKSFGLTSTIKEKKEKAVTNKKIKKEKAIANMKARRKFDPSIEEATELKNTMSCREIGALFGVSHVAVYNRLIKMGILEKK